MSDSEQLDQQRTGEHAVDPVLTDEAKLFGWVPREEFRGDEAQWVDAETFVKRGKEINPILKKNNERLMGELRKRDQEIAEMRLTMQEFGEMHRKTTETAYKRAIEEVKGQLRTARRDGDHELMEQLEEQRDSLVEESKNITVPGAKTAQTVSKEAAQARLEEWAGQNAWYDAEKNPDLVYAADGFAVRLAKSRPDLVGTKEFLDSVTAEVKRVAPDRFKNPRRETGSPVGGGGEARGGSRPGGKQTYADLPAEAKAACDRFVKQIPGYTREKYVQQFFEG